MNEIIAHPQVSFQPLGAGGTFIPINGHFGTFSARSPVLKIPAWFFKSGWNFQFRLKPFPFNHRFFHEDFFQKQG